MRAEIGRRSVSIARRSVNPIATSFEDNWQVPWVGRNVDLASIHAGFHCLGHNKTRATFSDSPLNLPGSGWKEFLQYADTPITRRGLNVEFAEEVNAVNVQAG